MKREVDYGVYRREVFTDDTNRRTEPTTSWNDQMPCLDPLYMTEERPATAPGI